MGTSIYRTKDGKGVDSVTTILGILNKPALIFWGYTIGLENYARITESIARECGVESEDPLNRRILRLLQEFQVGPLYEKRDKAATAGTLAHLFVENHLKGLPDPPTKGLYSNEIIKKAEGCYLAYCEWERTHDFKVVRAEMSLVSEIHRFGGTFDIGAVLGDMAMVDIKTSKGIYPVSMVPQIAAYGQLYNEHHPENQMKGYHIIRLGEDGAFEHKYWPDVAWAWKVFLGCLDIKNILNKEGIKL